MGDLQLQTQQEFRESHSMLSDICGVCKKPIHIMCRKYTGICSENCEKRSAGKPVSTRKDEPHHASE